MTTTNSKPTESPLAYIGPIGAGLGFRLSGITVAEATSGEEALAFVRQYKEAATYSIIFIDEGLAAEVLADIEKLNNDTIPAIVLLPNPANPQNLTQQTMNNLVIQAVGSDIFNQA